ncbi:MAG: nucleoside deaminase [Muribaculaceae bacterium]|nr:nucleoside deaminase [Muribaculaceae bacterium]
MELAARLSYENIENGGGPFGAVIVNKNGEVVATGVNRVTANNDPTAHAEVSAIREACSKLKTFNLKGHTIYSSCEPCPMCLSALYWAGLDKLYFGNTKEDAEAIDFSDKFIYDELALPIDRRHLPSIKVDNRETIKAFEKWASDPDKVKY